MAGAFSLMSASARASADVAAKVAGGRLAIDRLTGGLFGGRLQATGSVDANSRNRLQTAVKMAGLDIARALQAATGRADAGGRMDLDMNLTGNATSVDALVRSLGGGGALKMTGVDVKKGGGGTVLVGALGLVTAVNQLGGVLGGKRKGPGLADLSGSFAIDQGIVSTKDLKVASNFGNGLAAGSVNLPGWSVDLSGRIELAADLVSQLLKGSGQREPVPFSVKGSLDAPNIKVDTARLAIGVLPGANKLLDKAPPVARGLLQGILGGGAAGQSAPQGQTQPQGGSARPPAQNQPPPQQQQQQQNPIQEIEKRLKKILPF